MDRIGARAFLHLGGLCGPELAKRSRLSPDTKENARPPSWFSSEIGTKADAKQSVGLLRFAMA